MAGPGEAGLGTLVTTIVQTNRFMTSKYYNTTKMFPTFWCYLNNLVQRIPYFVKLDLLENLFWCKKKHVLVLDLREGIIIWHPPKSYYVLLNWCKSTGFGANSMHFVWFNHTDIGARFRSDLVHE